MPNQQNQQTVAQLDQKFEQAKSIVIANYSGLNVSQQNELRAKLREAGGSLSVVKNRLFKIAAEKHIGGADDQLTQALNGQNAFLFSNEDAVSALKALFSFAKDNENLEIKIGLLDGKVLNYQDTENLSKLPSKPELIAQLISRIQGPTFGLVNVIAGPTRSLVYVLNAIKKSKE